MKHFVLLSCLLVLIVTLDGCQSETETIPKAAIFSINVDAAENVQAGKPFIVKGTLVNNSKRTWELQHGADMFTYDVYNRKGKLVLHDIVRIDAIGIVGTLKPNEGYSYDGEGHVHPKMNELTLQAGSFEIVSIAKFRIKHDGKVFDFDIESPPLKIKIS